MTRLAVFIATVGYCGYFPFAPGTVGSAAGLLFYLVVWWTGSTAVEIGLIVALFAAGVWAGTIAERYFGGSTLMICEEFPEYGIRSPRSLGGTAVTIHLHVDDADAVVERALARGAQLHMPLADHFYGERSGSFFDPFGHRWNVGHHIENVTPEEMQRRYDENPDN